MKFQRSQLSLRHVFAELKTRRSANAVRDLLALPQEVTAFEFVKNSLYILMELDTVLFCIAREDAMDIDAGNEAPG